MPFSTRAPQERQTSESVFLVFFFTTICKQNSETSPGFFPFFGYYFVIYSFISFSLEVSIIISIFAKSMMILTKKPINYNCIYQILKYKSL